MRPQSANSDRRLRALLVLPGPLLLIVQGLRQNEVLARDTTAALLLLVVVLPLTLAAFLYRRRSRHPLPRAVG